MTISTLHVTVTSDPVSGRCPDTRVPRCPGARAGGTDWARIAEAISMGTAVGGAAASRFTMWCRYSLPLVTVISAVAPERSIRWYRQGTRPGGRPRNRLARSELYRPTSCDPPPMPAAAFGVHRQRIQGWIDRWVPSVQRLGSAPSGVGKPEHAHSPGLAQMNVVPVQDLDAVTQRIALRVLNGRQLAQEDADLPHSRECSTQVDPSSTSSR